MKFKVGDYITYNRKTIKLFSIKGFRAFKISKINKWKTYSYIYIEPIYGEDYFRQSCYYDDYIKDQFRLIKGKRELHKINKIEIFK